MGNKKSIGLRGGPNEFLQTFTDNISIEGYRRNSPDVNKLFNVIPSGDISMEGVDFPVVGTDNLGNTKTMQPGMNYQFPGDSVLETPLAQLGSELVSLPDDEFYNPAYNNGPKYGPKEEPPKSALSEFPELFQATKTDNINFPFAKPKVVTVFAETPNGYVPKYDFGSVQRNLPPSAEYNTWPEDLKKQYNKGRQNVNNALIKYKKERGDVIEIVRGKFHTEDELTPGSQEFLKYHTAKNKLIKLQKEFNEVAFYEQSIFDTITKEGEEVPWKSDTFITEADNVKKWYEKNEPSTVVNVIPFYGDADVIRNNTINLNPEDDIIMMGHSGDRIGGVPNGEISNILSESPATDCFMGSCSFEGYAADYNLRKGQTFSFRPESPWLGFDPTADTFAEGMWGRNYQDKEGNFMDFDATPASAASYTPKITELKENVTDKTITYKRGGDVNDGFKSLDPRSSNNSNTSDATYGYQTGGGVNKEGVKQYNWFKKYMQSPKYAERLKKEFPDYNNNQIGLEVKSRLENVMQTNVGFLPYSSKESKGPGDVQGFYGDENYPNTMMLRPEYSASTPDRIFEPGNYLSPYKTIPLHEWSHVADNVGKRIPPSTKDYMLSRMKENSSGKPKDEYYYTMPTEYLGRMQPLRYLMQQEGLYDAGTEDFTIEHLEKARQNKTIKNNAHFEDLMQYINSDESFIELMNNVASLDNNKSSGMSLAQTGGEQLPKAQDGIEETINNYLGNPYVEAREFAENPDRTRGSDAYNIDNMRHAQASRLVQEAIANKTGNIPFISNALGFLGSNALGVGHELKTLLNPIYDRDLSTELQESGEDIFNNFFGSVVGTLPIDDKTKDYIIKYASNNNMLPDGFAKDKKQEVLDGFSGNKYFKDKEGNIKKPEYKRGGNVLPKAQDGTETEVNNEYKVQSGDTFYGIANKNNVSWETLKNANPDVNIESLGLNQNIIIPKAINRSPPMPETRPSKNSNVLNYNTLSNYLVETRGGTIDTWGQLADTIAYHEAGSQQRGNPLAKQISQRADGTFYDGPGRGVFQFENESFETAQKRYKNIASSQGFSLKEDIVNATSADQLSLEDQYAVFLANLIESKAKLSDFATGNSSSLDVWLSGHKNVESKGNRKSFLESKISAEKEGIKNGYKTFKEGGDIENHIMYKNYVNGVYEGSKMQIKGAKIYDKLNRIHYRDAKASNMAPANYVMTNIIG